MIRDIIKRAAGLGDGKPDCQPFLIEMPAELDSVLTFAFPKLSILEKERQSIAGKREKLGRDIEDFDAAIAFHEGEIARFKADRAATARILASLERHASDISDPPAPLGDVFVGLVETPSGSPVAEAAE